MIRIAERLQAMGHPVRLMIIGALKGGESAVGDLADKLGLTMGQVSQHLRALERVQLLQSRREGRHVYYAIAAPMVNDVCQAVCRQMTTDLEHQDQQRAVFERLRDRLQG